MNRLDATDHFATRHIGPSADDTAKMLEAIGAASLDARFDAA
jgi:glycine cleavage system pyridoxal-binding protein P